MRIPKKYSQILLTVILLSGSYQVFADKQMVGWVENVTLHPGGIPIKAKIDTGAKSSSLGCDCITPINKNSGDYVKFSIKNELGQVQWFEEKITRTVKIKRHFGESQRRYVVQMGLCLGDTYKVTDVTLVDRTGLNYQLLVGRRFLEGSHTVDSEKTFMTKPNCKISGKSK